MVRRVGGDAAWVLYLGRRESTCNAWMAAGCRLVTVAVPPRTGRHPRRTSPLPAHLLLPVSFVALRSFCSGKSSRVPQFLLEDVGGPVLCTQPRRLAAVAIAKRGERSGTGCKSRHRRCSAHPCSH